MGARCHGAARGRARSGRRSLWRRHPSAACHALPARKGPCSIFPLLTVRGKHPLSVVRLVWCSTGSRGASGAQRALPGRLLWRASMLGAHTFLRVRRAATRVSAGGAPRPREEAAGAGGGPGSSPAQEKLAPYWSFGGGMHIRDTEAERSALMQPCAGSAQSRRCGCGGCRALSRVLARPESLDETHISFRHYVSSALSFILACSTVAGACVTR